MLMDKIRANMDKRYNTDLTVRLIDCGFTARTFHTLRKGGMATVGDLTKLSWKQLSGIRNSTRSTCQEVSDKLEDMGLSLRKDGR